MTISKSKSKSEALNIAVTRDGKIYKRFNDLQKAKDFAKQEKLDDEIFCEELNMIGIHASVYRVIEL